MRIRAMMVAGGAALLLAGCVTDGDRDRPGRPERPERPDRPHRPDRPDRPGHGGGSERECKSDRGQSMIGRAADDRAIASIRRATHSRTVRVVKPGQPVTMDFRPDRLTVEVDHRNRIVSARCG